MKQAIKSFFSKLYSISDSITMGKPQKKQYAIVTHHSANALVSGVNSAIEKGWHPIGGVSHMRLKIGGNQYDHVEREYWSQAMIK